MAIEGFDEIANTVYIAKRLSDMGKYELVENSFFDSLVYDAYYDYMYTLIENLFARHHCRYYENRYVEYHVLSDPVMVDFYTLAGEYGRRHDVCDAVNPYLKAAQQQAGNRLNFSYCLDWMLMGHTKPRRPFHSRLALFISMDDYVDMGMLAYGLVELYGWFAEQCVILHNLLVSSNPREEAMAA